MEKEVVEIYTDRKIYGVDVNAEAIEGARKNFATLEGADHVELIAEDGRITADRLEGPFDFVHLDADDEKIGKGMYLELLKKLFDKLVPGAWVLAHDTTHPTFHKTKVFEEYLEFVRDRRNFSESISFDVDVCGLELSIK